MGSALMKGAVKEEIFPHPGNPYTTSPQKDNLGRNIASEA